MNNKKETLKSLSLAALFSAIICICAVMVIPVGAVPISLASFAVMLCGFTLSRKSSILSVAVYLLLGACGLPVFSSFKGGIQVLIGPTGGYLWGYLVLVLFCSFAQSGGLKAIVFSVIGNLLLYILGTLQFMLIMNTTFYAALLVCVFPFVVFDALKGVAAYFLAKRFRKIIYKE